MNSFSPGTPTFGAPAMTEPVHPEFRGDPAPNLARGTWGTRALRVLALLAPSILSFPAPAQGDEGSGKASPPAPPTTYALLIGCTEFKELEKTVSPETYEKLRLEGCANDVEALRKALEDRLGLRPENTTALAGWPTDPAARPTRTNIAQALEALATRTYAAGDLVVVHYSGHGVQVPDDNGDEQDGLDEAWFVSDSKGGPSTGFVDVIRDDAIGAWLRRIRAHGARAWCILDCCHSGTGTRGAEGEPTRRRRIDPGTLGIVLEPSTRGLPASPPSSGSTEQDPAAPTPVDARAEDLDGAPDGVVAFYGAQSFQEVPEVQIRSDDGSRTAYGLLTTAVVRGLGRSGGTLSYGELFEQVVGVYRELGQQHRVQPYVEGELSGMVVGGGKAATLTVRRIKKDWLELSAGALLGVAAGTELAVYAPDRFGDPEARLGVVEVKRLRPDASVVVPKAGTDDAWSRGEISAWPAEVAKYEFGSTRLPIALVDASLHPVPDETCSEALRRVLDDDVVRARHPRVASAEKAKWLVVLDGQGEPTELRPTGAGPGAPSFRVSSGTLGATLMAVHRAENLLRLASHGGGARLPPNLRLVVERTASDGSRKPVQPGAQLAPGTRLWFRLEKDPAQGPRDVGTLDVYVFWVHPHFGIDRIYPTQKSGPRLTKDDVTSGSRPPIECRNGRNMDEAVGLEHVLVLAVPKRDGSPPLKLDFLEQGAPPIMEARGEGDPVKELLSDLAFGPPPSRDGAPKVDAGAAKMCFGVFTWETRWGEIRVPLPVAGQPAATVPSAPVVAPPGFPPDGRSFGPDLRLGQAGEGKDAAWCLLVARGDGAIHVLLDLDGEVPEADRTETGLARLVRDPGAFDAELAIRLEQTRALVWYDTDGDGRFDVVLIDTNRDGRAEVGYRLKGETWTKQSGLDEPLLSTTHFVGLELADRKRATYRLRTLAGG